MIIYEKKEHVIFNTFTSSGSSSRLFDILPTVISDQMICMVLWKNLKQKSNDNSLFLTE